MDVLDYCMKSSDSAGATPLLLGVGGLQWWAGATLKFITKSVVDPDPYILVPLLFD